jgi:dTDP-4-amino-4,6-dideoxygalactose transaminase
VIPFNRPFLTARERAYVRQAVASGHTSGDGPYTRRATDLLTALVGARSALLTTSCTHALELTALLLDLATGKSCLAEVLVSGRNRVPRPPASTSAFMT